MADVFIAYSRNDKDILQRLQTHLSPLKRRMNVEAFSDTQIETDENWRGRIHSELSSARFAILLVSADFLASDFINEVELPALVEKRKSGTLKIFTLFVSPCNVDAFPEIIDFQAFNAPDAPLMKLIESEREEILARLSSEIGQQHEILLSAKPKQKSIVSVERMEDELPEADYSSARRRKFFTDEKVSISRLATELDGSNLIGFSFERCLIYGPAIVCLESGSLSNCSIGRPKEETEGVFFQTRSKSLVTGVVSLAKCDFERCAFSNIGFLEVPSNKPHLEELRRSIEAS